MLFMHSMENKPQRSPQRLNTRAKPPIGECGTCADRQKCELGGVFEFEGISGYCPLYKEAAATAIITLCASAACIATLILFLMALPGAAWRFFLWAWGL